MLLFRVSKVFSCSVFMVTLTLINYFKSNKTNRCSAGLRDSTSFLRLPVTFGLISSKCNSSHQVSEVFPVANGPMLVDSQLAVQKIKDCI